MGYTRGRLIKDGGEGYIFEVREDPYLFRSSTFFPSSRSRFFPASFLVVSQPGDALKG